MYPRSICVKLGRADDLYHDEATFFSNIAHRVGAFFFFFFSSFLLFVRRTATHAQPDYVRSQTTLRTESRGGGGGG